MNISDIRVKILDSGGKIKAVAAITFDACFVVHDVKIIQGAESLFVTMPGRKSGGREIQGHRPPHRYADAGNDFVRRAERL